MMIRLAVVARVGGEPFESNTRASLALCRLKVLNVGLGSLVGQVTEDKMICTVDQHSKLRITRVFSGLPEIRFAATTLDEVLTRVPRFKPSRVNCSQCNPASTAHYAANRVVQQPRDRSGAKQPPSRFMKRRVVRHIGKLDGRTQRRAVRQMGGQATIVGFKKRLQNQASKELMRVNFFGLHLWLNLGRTFCATTQAVASTFLGDLLVLLIHVDTNTTAAWFVVFYRAVLTPLCTYNDAA